MVQLVDNRYNSDIGYAPCHDDRSLDCDARSEKDIVVHRHVPAFP